MKTVFHLAIVLALIPSEPVNGVETPGIVTDRPTAGRFVKVDGGYMVPYEVKIPYTNASFWMEPIPPGEFRMGSPESEPGRDDMEGPQATYQVDPFWMARCEVTQGQYREYMAMYSVFKMYDFKQYVQVTEENRVDAVSAPTVIYEPMYVFEPGEHVDMPIITMSQYAARQYSKWLSLITESQFRLPTEAEWEYACRAGTTTAYHFGDDPAKLINYSWYSKNSFDEGLRKVGTKKPNRWGLYDMHGNVAEWVHDHYQQYPAGDRVRNAAQDWVRKDAVDPKCVRGGGWYFDAQQCRSAARLPSDMEAWREDDPDLPKSPWWMTTDPARCVGMRLVRPLKKMTPAQLKEFWEPLDEETRFDVEDRVNGGRGAMGIVSRELMKAIQIWKEKKK